MKKKQPKRPLSKKELLEMLLNHEQTELDKMDEMVDLLIAKNITINVNSEREEEKTFGEKMADAVADFAGSWIFIITFILILLLWIIANVYFINKPFDKFPFILLNLILSCVAALQAPVIMMSQKRQEKKDRLRSDNDYKIDLKAEFILEDMYNKLTQLNENQETIQKQIDDIKKLVKEEKGII
ncbi:MAG: DUF1003 domain-containing protein [Bacilli bacterium]